MQKVRVIAGAGLLAATMLAGINPAGASPSAPAVRAGGELVRVARLADTAVPRGAADLGQYGTTRPVDFEVVLSSSNPAGELALAQDEYTASSPLYHHWLTPAAFDAEFGPSSATVSATDLWLQSKGLTAKRSSEFAISVSGTAKQVSAALGTGFESYRVGNRVGYAARQAPLVPAGVEGQVDGILGLNTLQRPEAQNAEPLVPAAGAEESKAAVTAGSSQSVRGAPTDCSGADQAVSSAGEGYTMLGEADTYGVDALWSDGLEGTGQKIGLFELANYNGSDIVAYESCFGINVPVTHVGSAPADYNYGGTAEADLDIEEAATQAPQSSIVAYEADDSTGDPSVLYNLWNTIVNADAVQTVSTSWGLCEPDNDGSVTGSIDRLLEQAALQGQSVFAAAGDSGSEDCAADFYEDPTPSYWASLTVDYPGSSPWITSVGGTDGDSTSDLEAWNDCSGQASGSSSPCLGDPYYGYGAGGGGASTHEAASPWQQYYFKVAGYRAASGCGSVCREVPDVSVDAGYPIAAYSSSAPGNGNGSWGLGVGTSFGAPFMAGVVADRNQGCDTSTGSFAALAYGLSLSSNSYQDSFIDVQSGNNDMLNETNDQDYTAVAGYDMATGLGTPIPVGIACPEVTSVSANNVSPGMPVTLTGIGLQAASIYFGGALASVTTGTTPTATSITVTVPQGSGHTTIYGALDGISGKQTVGFTFGSAGTGPSPTCAGATGFSMPGAVGVSAVTINGCPGYFVVDAQGRVAAFGSATTHGDLSQVHLGSPIVAMAATADGEGYYLIAAGGGIFCYGDAVFHGAASSYGPAKPIVGIAVVPNGSGYWEVESNGGLFAFSAGFYGSMGGKALSAPIVGMAVAPGGKGYWMVASNGGIFAFHATFQGSLGGHPPTRPIVGMSSTPSGNGYTLVGSDGKVYKFGDAQYYGQPANAPGSPIVDLSPTPADNGYYLATSAGGIFDFGPGTKYFGGV